MYNEILLDTINISKIKRTMEIMPISGVTSNPSIVSKEGKINFFEHLKEIRSLIGNRTLHVQVVSTQADEIIKEAKYITEKIDKEVYIKIPVNEEGLKAIRHLKQEGMNITATAIYTKLQADLAVLAGADYLAPYYNRMEDMDINPYDVLTHIQDFIERNSSDAKLLVASFKNIAQVTQSFETGARAITVDPDILLKGIRAPYITKAVDDFTKDWQKVFPGTDSITQI